MSNLWQKIATNFKKKTARATCFIHNTEFSQNVTELKLLIYKNISSANYNMVVAKENCIL